MDISLTDLANLENEATATAAINANNAVIEAAFDDVLTTTGPNVLSDDVDMNSNRILNLPAAVLSTEPVRKAEFDASPVGAATTAAAAATAAAATAVTATTAANAAAVAALAAAAAAGSATVADGSVTANKLATNSVSTIKILDSNVTTAKIADANVTTVKIADANVTTAKILDANVTTAKIAADAVTNAKLADMVTDTIKGNLTGSTGNPTDIALADLVTAILATGSFTASPVGSVAPLAHSTVPSGWLECNGAAVPRSTYSSLFALVSTTYGTGNGTTTFNLPDLRGEFIRGWDHSRGIDTSRAIGSSQGQAIQAHTHTATTVVASSSATTANGDDTRNYVVSGSITTDSTGGTDTRPRNIALMYCIKY